MSPITLDPITKNAVPWKAVKIRNTKKDAKSGARAVPIENAKNSAALATETYKSQYHHQFRATSVMSPHPDENGL